MSEEKKREKSKNKIVPFDFEKDMMENHEVDELILESLKKEADELEKRLNSDPALVGVGASDDLFQSIVGKLKEQGIWEEEEPPSEEDSEEEEQSSEETAAITEAESAEDTEDNPQKRDPAAASEVTEALAGQDADNSEKQKAGQPDLERIYEMLPEEDRKAMELGRRVERLNQEKTRKRRRRRKVWKRVGVAAALVAVLGGVSLTSEANRRLVRKAWDAVTANLGFRIPTNYVEEAKSIRSKGKEEIAAMEDISEILGISIIDFGYMPEEMDYLEYICEADTYQAALLYSYKDTVFSIKMIKENAEGGSYYMLDNEPVLRENIMLDQNIKVKIWEANVDLDIETYIAEMEYEDCTYILNGIITLEEMKKMVKSIYFI